MKLSINFQRNLNYYSRKKEGIFVRKADPLVRHTLHLSISFQPSASYLVRPWSVRQLKIKKHQSIIWLKWKYITCLFLVSPLTTPHLLLSVTSYKMWCEQCPTRRVFQYWILVPLGIPHICHGRRPCKFFLAGVNFYRFSAKNLLCKYRCKFHPLKILPV